MMRIHSGCSCIDSNLDEEIDPETITLIYGSPETGKSTLAMQFSANCANQGLKVLFVDCDNSFSPKRLSQISGGKFEEIAERIILIRPKNFQEQIFVVDHIQDYTNEKIGLIVFDTLTSLYGAKVCETSNKPYELNRELNRQLAILAQTVKIKKIPMIITSQVRCILDDQNENVRPVATRVLKFWANKIIALKPTELPQIIKVLFENKDNDIPEALCYVQIGESGIQDTQFP
jgi:RecA/RadA recombinase